MKKLLFSYSLLLVSCFSFSQIGIGTNTPNTNALLEINSSTKGILIPRTSTTTRLTIPATKGLMVYDTTTSSFWFNDGTNWTEALNGNNGWGIKGNSNTNPSVNFIGTADNQSLRFRLNNNWAGEWNRTTRNYSVGAGAMQGVGLGSGNVAIGSGAIGTNSVSNGIVAIGDSALYGQNSIVGVNNVAVGRKALFANRDGLNNTAIGYLSLPANSDGRDNTALGASSLNQNTLGNFNIALGSFALFNNLDGDINIAIGRKSMYNNIVGNYSVAIGDSAMFSSTYCCNVALGNNAMKDLDGFSYYNTAIGNNAMSSAGGGTNNTAVGESALKSSTYAEYNTAVGSYTLNHNTTGDNNVALGSAALNHNTTGNANIAVGTYALFFNQEAYKNIAIGHAAQAQNISGNANLAIGDSALYASNSNCCNIAIGSRAMRSIFGYSYYNTVLGNNALALSTSGFENTAIGQGAMFSFINGGGANTAVGAGALSTITTGLDNTGLGAYANVLNGFSYATAIGAGSEVACSNCMALGGNSGTYRTKVGINQSTPFTDLHIIQQSDNGLDKTRGIRIQRSTGSNQWRTLIDPGNNYIFEYNNSLYSYIEPAGGAFVNPSDERLKKNIEPLNNVLDKLLMLQAKTYQYNLTDAAYSATRLTGFLAQDVEKIFPEFVHTGQNGYRGIAYHNFGIIAVKAIQEQQQMISSLKTENEELKREIKLIKEKLGL